MGLIGDPADESPELLAIMDRWANPAPQPDDDAPPPARRPRRQLGHVPVCWTWEFDPGTPIPADTFAQHQRLVTWQDERCAVCGSPDADREDHDHQTGLTRGYLCGSCNVREASSGLRVFALYRWRHPTSILGLTLPYSGRGWKNGQRTLPF